MNETWLCPLLTDRRREVSRLRAEATSPLSAPGLAAARISIK